jgi:DNA-binding winged helix-turn-helix (wHTH) protein/Tol biopolymer transport system component
MANHRPQLVEFGPFSLDRGERVLRRDGRPVPLRPKDFDMLAVLVENSGRIVEKEDLLKQVWPDTFVEEANLSHHIFTLRKALGEGDEESRFIETVPRRGYRFVAPVTVASAAMSITDDVPFQRRIRSRRWRKAAIAAALLGAAGAAVYRGWLLEAKPSARVTRSVITLAQGDVFTRGPATMVSLSPDGTHLVYIANERLYVRALERLEAEPIPGIERPGLASARVPFFSPDGQWIGFWEQRLLKKVSIRGGAPVALCDLESPPYGATWADDGTILLGYGSRGVLRVSADGGKCETIISVSTGQRVHGPQLLPDGKTVLFTLAESANWDDGQVVVQSLVTGARRAIVSGTDGRYLPTGHLAYTLRDTVFGVQFDPVDLRMTGVPVPVVEGVRRLGNAFGAAAQFGVSSTGVLAYVEAAKSPPAGRTLVWVDRRGREEAIPADRRAYIYPRISPDGKRLALDIHGDNRDIWVWDFSRQLLTPVTTDPGRDVAPVWTHDGQRLVFLSQRTGIEYLFWQPADGSGTAERLSDGLKVRGADTATPDGRWLIVREGDGKGTFDLALLELPVGPGWKPTSATKPLVRSSSLESNAEVSRDRRWLAYQSNISGSLEVYLRPFADLDERRWQVSSGGGTEPLWSSESRELFYRSPSGAVMRVSIDPQSTTPPGTPTKLFDAKSHALGGRGEFAELRRRTYDVSLDGRRFLMIKNGNAQTTSATPERIVLVQNWFEELKAKLSK